MGGDQRQGVDVQHDILRECVLCLFQWCYCGAFAPRCQEIVLKIKPPTRNARAKDAFAKLPTERATRRNVVVSVKRLTVFSEKPRLKIAGAAEGVPASHHDKVGVCMNVVHFDAPFVWWWLSCDGVKPFYLGADSLPTTIF